MSGSWEDIIATSVPPYNTELYGNVTLRYAVRFAPRLLRIQARIRGRDSSGGRVTWEPTVLVGNNRPYPNPEGHATLGLQYQADGTELARQSVRVHLVLFPSEEWIGAIFPYSLPQVWVSTSILSQKSLLNLRNFPNDHSLEGTGYKIRGR